MKNILIVLLFACSILISAAQTPAPAPTQADLEKLVQQEKWSEAAQAVETLLKASPDDATLKGYKDEITKHLIATTPPLVSPPATAPAPAITPLSGEDKLEWNTLLLIVNDAQSAETPETKQKALAEYLDKSTGFVAKHPDFIKAWQFRALAAMELNKAQEGNEAGLKLKALGALDSDDPAVMTLMASLNRKGWLKPTYAEVQAFEAGEKDRAQNEITDTYAFLVGTYSATHWNWSSNPNSTSCFGTITITREKTQLRISGKIDATEILIDVNGRKQFSGLHVEMNTLVSPQIKLADGKKACSLQFPVQSHYSFRSQDKRENPEDTDETKGYLSVSADGQLQITTSGQVDLRKQ